MALKAVFFDTSDTLYHSPDFKKAQSRQPVIQLSKRRDITLEEAKELFSKTKEELKSRMVHVPKVAVMMELGVSRLEMQESLAEIDPRDFLQPDEKLNAVLKGLGGRFELGVITNVLRKFLDNILDALGVDKTCFKYIVSVDNTVNSKPHEEPFLKAIELSGLEPSECVYVGDSFTKDMIPARKAGMKTVWVSQEAVEDESVDVRIKSIYEIEEALSQLLE